MVPMCVSQFSAPKAIASALHGIENLAVLRDVPGCDLGIGGHTTHRLRALCIVDQENGAVVVHTLDFHCADFVVRHHTFTGRALSACDRAMTDVRDPRHASSTVANTVDAARRRRSTPLPAETEMDSS